MRLDNIVLPIEQNAVAFLVPDMKLQAGAVLHMLPDTTKNKKGGHCKTTLQLNALCFSTWLQLAVPLYSAAGQPITNFIIRPLAVGTKQFAEKPEFTPPPAALHAVATKACQAAAHQRSSQTLLAR